jgi:cytoskeletal protein RodZ
MIGRRQLPSARQDDVADSAPRGFDDYDLRLGDLMRGERATIGRSLLDVQRDLKIRASYIAAIENCDIGAFETPGFVAGYVRSYARYLGMDPEWAYRRFCDEAGFAPLDGIAASAARRTPPAERPLPRVGAGAHMSRDPFVAPRYAPRSESLLDRLNPGALGSIAVLLALIAGLGYGGWQVLQEVQRVQVAPVDAVPGVLAELDPLAGAPLPDPGAGASPELASPASDRPDRMFRPPALDVPIMVARDGPIAAIDPDREGALADLAPSSATGSADPVDAVAAAVARSLAAEGETELPAVQVSEAGPPPVEILAVRPAWIRVQSADGAVLFERILEAGERYVVPNLEAPARLRAGNSGAVYFVVNGQTYGPAAPGANIARNVELSAEALRGGFAVADLARDPDLARIAELGSGAAAD